MEEQRPGKQCVQSRRPEPAWRTAGISRLRSVSQPRPPPPWPRPPPGPLNSAPARLPSGPVRPGHAQCGRSRPGPGSARAERATRCGGVGGDERARGGRGPGWSRAGAGAAAAKLPGRCAVRRSRALAPRSPLAGWTPAAGAARAWEGSRPERGVGEAAGGGCGRVSRTESASEARQGWGGGTQPGAPRADLCPGAARLGLVHRVTGGAAVSAPRARLWLPRETSLHWSLPRSCGGDGPKGPVGSDRPRSPVRREDAYLSAPGVGCDSHLPSGLGFSDLEMKVQDCASVDTR